MILGPSERTSEGPAAPNYFRKSSSANADPRQNLHQHISSMMAILKRDVPKTNCNRILKLVVYNVGVTSNMQHRFGRQEREREREPQNRGEGHP